MEIKIEVINHDGEKLRATAKSFESAEEQLGNLQRYIERSNEK